MIHFKPKLCENYIVFLRLNELKLELDNVKN